MIATLSCREGTHQLDHKHHQNDGKDHDHQIENKGEPALNAEEKVVRFLRSVQEVEIPRLVMIVSSPTLCWHSMPRGRMTYREIIAPPKSSDFYQSCE